MKKLLLLCMISIFCLTGLSNNDNPKEIEKVNLKLEENQLAITFLDLPSGEITLFQHPNGENVLINTGGPNTEKELKKLLDMYGINTVSRILLTSDDYEFNSNLKWLVENYKITEILTGRHSSPPMGIEEEKVSQWKKGDKSEILPGLSVEVIHEEENIKGSIGMDLLFSFGEHKILYMTSADKDVEKSLFSEYDLSDVNILKVADFASSKGTSQAFLEHVDPQVAVIFQKEDLLPSQDVIERLQETWIDIYHTKQFGNITLKCNKENYEIITISVESIQQIE